MKYRTFLSPEELTSSEDESEYILSSLFKMSSIKGYSMWSAAVFISSFMAGLGVVAVPHAMSGTGWYGLILIALACLNSWYSALVLGRTYVILEERWEEYRGKFRYPYPAMGQRAVGNWMRYVVSGTLNVTLLGIAVVYVLVAASIGMSMTEHLFTLSYKNWIIVLAVFLCPLTWFGSIEEFWFAAVGALATAGLACIATLVAVIMEIPHMKHVTYDTPNLTSASLAFGTIIFSFGGTYICPTVQNDMTDRRQVNKSTILAFIGLLVLYLPMSVAGYAVLGSSAQPNVLLSLSESYLRTFVEACFAVHILLASLIAINPIAQEIEEALGVPSDFNYKRCLIRSLIVGFVLLVGYTIPHFEKVLNLIGGSTITLLTFVYPPLFYLLINKKDSKGEVSKRNVPLLEKIFLAQIMIVGIIGGVICTYFATLDIISIFLHREEANSTNDLS